MVEDSDGGQKIQLTSATGAAAVSCGCSVASVSSVESSLRRPASDGWAHMCFECGVGVKVGQMVAMLLLKLRACLFAFFFRGHCCYFDWAFSSSAVLLGFLSTVVGSVTQKNRHRVCICMHCLFLFFVLKFQMLPPTLIFPATMAPTN